MKKLLAVVLSFAMLASMTFAVGAETDAELIAYWNFDSVENGTVADVSGNGNTLTFQDSAYSIVDGYSGTTFDFNGGTTAYDNSKHLTMDSKEFVKQINGAEALTFTAVMKKEVKGSGTNFTMFCLNAGSNSILLYAKANELVSAIRSNYNGAAVNTYASNVIYPNADDATTPDSWMHVALVCDYGNNNVKIYADGVLVGEEKTESSVQSFPNSVASYDATKDGWFGVGGRHVLVDDFKVYKGALSEEEIKKSVPPVLEYDFEETSGGDILDKTVNAKHITVGSSETVEGAEGNTQKLSNVGTLPVATHRGILYGAKEQSLSCWVKLADGTLPSSAQALFAEGEQDGFRLELTPNGAISVGGKSTAGDGYVSLATEDGVFANGDSAWHHLYVDLDYVAKKGRIFINGNLASEAALAFSGNYYGMSGEGSSNDYIDLSQDSSILMDSLKIYRRALLDEEIKELAEVLPMVKADFSKTADSVTATCDIINFTDGNIAENTMTLILGAYSKNTGRLVNGAMVNLPALAKYRGLNDQAVTISGLDNPSGYDYKLFAWYGIGGVASYQDAVEYTFD